MDIARLRQAPAPRRRQSEPYPGYFHLSEGWAMVAPAMATAALLLALSGMALPDHYVLLAAALAVGLVALSPLFVRLERAPRRSPAQRYAVMSAAVGLPMALFGAGLGRWLATGAMASPVLGIGALLVVTLVVAIVQSGRLPALLLAITALWTGPALVAGTWAAVVILLLGALAGLAAALRQIGLDRQAQAEQREMRRVQMRAEEILSDYEQTGQGWFWETDRRGILTYVSAPIGALLGRRQEDLLGRPLGDLFEPELLAQDNEAASGQGGERSLHFHLNARSPFQDISVRAATPHEERWWAISGRPVYDGFNNFLGFRGSGSDLTEQRRSQQRASRLAHYDSLTGLANRFQMSQTLEKILIAPKIDHRACAVFLLDLDRFKQVNDTMGHPAGDALLKQVAQRLERSVGDMGKVGRLGGDEFKVILPGRVAREKLGGLAQQIIDSLSQPYSIEGARVMIGASVGIAIAPEDGVTSEAIIRNADLALYAAKDRGRGCYHFYAADLHSDAEERRQLEHDLRDAITHGGLELFYQPVVHTGTERITGFEALMRWHHPTRGWLSPTKFIPVAEEAGLIAPLGEWALRTACHDLARWPTNVRVAVNVSPLQFANPQLPGIVTSALAAAQVAPGRLELEITESVFLNDDAGTDAMFAALKRVGVRLALDDFGTGYSSLGYLKKAPFDKIKIDQSFVRGATQPGSRNGAIIASIVSLADALGMETTAEGVQTLDELDLVRELGCSHVQGYIYAEPLRLADVTERVHKTQAIVASGPRSARPARRTMLRKVLLDLAGEKVPVTIRNLSETGAMIEGLYDVPAGLELNLSLSDEVTVRGTVRWCQYGRAGLEFEHALSFDESGMVMVCEPGYRYVQGSGEHSDGWRKVG
ncbi:MAG TPA: EAL domain-containing protein [Novosphingobium sp.]|nr:EAL domain-containing protein [Novosphingobium sp.]